MRHEWELTKWAEKLTMCGKKWHGFREPDIGNELTAIACLDDDGLFKKLRLL